LVQAQWQASDVRTATTLAELWSSVPRDDEAQFEVEKGRAGPGGTSV